MLTAIDKYVIGQVKARRLAKKVSQAALSLELNMHHSYIGHIESGKYDKKYNVSHLNTIAEVLECSPKDFMPEKPLKNTKHTASK